MELNLIELLVVFEMVTYLLCRKRCIVSSLMILYLALEHFNA